MAELQAKADGVSGQRNTLFKGETLRGLLLTAFAWSTVGMIAGYAAIGAFTAAVAAMLVLVVLGLLHIRKNKGLCGCFFRALTSRWGDSPSGTDPTRVRRC